MGLWILGALILVALVAVLVVNVIVLRSIEGQFLTNDGHSLRDSVDRLEETTQRIEVAAGLDREAVAEVAKDLDARDGRADAVEDGVPGEAADAHSRPPRVEL